MVRNVQTNFEWPLYPKSEDYNIDVHGWYYQAELTAMTRTILGILNQDPSVSKTNWSRRRAIGPFRKCWPLRRPRRHLRGHLRVRVWGCCLSLLRPTPFPLPAVLHRDARTQTFLDCPHHLSSPLSINSANPSRTERPHHRTRYNQFHQNFVQFGAL